MGFIKRRVRVRGGFSASPTGPRIVAASRIYRSPVRGMRCSVQCTYLPRWGVRVGGEGRGGSGVEGEVWLGRGVRGRRS